MFRSIDIFNNTDENIMKHVFDNIQKSYKKNEEKYDNFLKERSFINKCESL